MSAVRSMALSVSKFPGGAQVQTFEADMGWSLNGGGSGGFVLRAYYTVDWGSAADRGKGRGMVYIFRIDIAESADEKWTRANLPESLWEAMEKLIAEEEGVLEPLR